MSPTNREVYRKFSKQERKKIFEMLFWINNTILSMIKNGVVVLPKRQEEKKHNNDDDKTYLLHEHIESISIKQALKQYKYDNIMSKKALFLSCIKNKKKRNQLNKLIKDAVVKTKKINNKNKTSIKIAVNIENFSLLSEKEKISLKKDIFFLEKISTIINNAFIDKLPIALKQRRQKLSKITQVKKSIVPKTAKAISK